MKQLITFAMCFITMTAFAQKFEPEWVGEVKVLTVSGDTVANDTEKCNVQIKTSSSAARIITGFGNINQKITIKGGQSTSQIPLGSQPVYLVVKCKDNDSDPQSFIQIMKLEEKKKERKAELAKVNWIGNVSENNMKFVPFDAKRYGKSSYLLKINPVEGEFGVRVLNPNERDEKVLMLYCFGMH